MIAQVTIDFSKTHKLSLRKWLESSCIRAALRIFGSFKNNSLYQIFVADLNEKHHLESNVYNIGLQSKLKQCI